MKNIKSFCLKPRVVRDEPITYSVYDEASFEFVQGTITEMWTNTDELGNNTSVTVLFDNDDRIRIPWDRVSQVEFTTDTFDNKLSSNVTLDIPQSKLYQVKVKQFYDADIQILAVSEEAATAYALDPSNRGKLTFSANPSYSAEAVPSVTNTRLV